MARAGAALALAALFSILLAAQFVPSPLGLGLLRSAPRALASPNMGSLEVTLLPGLAGSYRGLDISLLRSALNQSARAYLYRLGEPSAPLPLELTPTRPIRLNLSAGAYGMSVEASGNFSLAIPRFSIQPGKETRIEIRVDAYFVEFIPMDVEDLNGDGCLGPGERAVGGLGLVPSFAANASLAMGPAVRLIWPPAHSARALLFGHPSSQIFLLPRPNGTQPLVLAVAQASILPQACVPDEALLSMPLFVLFFVPSYGLSGPEG